VATTEQKKDSTWTTTKEVHDTTYLTIQGPVKYLPSPCAQLCDSLGKLKPFKQTSKKNGITQTLQTVGDVLVQECDVDSLKQVITTLENTIHQQSSTFKEVQIHDNCKLEHRNDFDGFCRWFFYIMAPVVLVYLVLKFYFRLPI
jgi:hypothetical protein